MLPEAQRIQCNESTCNVLDMDGNGLGQGRQYNSEPSALLDPFKEPEFNLDSNKCRFTEDNLNYYPIDKINPLRTAHTGGGDVLTGGDPNVYN